ncbi:alpha-d-galacturonidase [Larkinella sp. GY13]|uniref:alpha-d-galacturonidase n=1 Tax=Larkinella sp. GY13 TaxID=3453720 RepID=UPI003EF084A1
MNRYATILLFSVLFCFPGTASVIAQETGKKVTIVTPVSAHVRVTFGAEKLKQALTKAGYQTTFFKGVPAKGSHQIVIGLWSDANVKPVSLRYRLTADPNPVKESFAIRRDAQNPLLIVGADPSGVLYGCLELAEKINETGQLPETISLRDQPEMVLRGTAVGIQKPVYLPGREVYEYPYTPETFPWLYDKALWIRYLDQMAENRYNSLYLWNGHPFASLVRLKDYPYAVEVDDATFRRNEEMFRFLTAEADKRGIWVIQMFYNIILSKPFAEKHNLKTQDRNRPITPLIADYTQKSIAAFVQKYPNVGLLITLGEAMEGVGQDDVDWFTKTIIPGVKDGLKALGQTAEPPIVLRAHDSDAPRVMKAALPLYKNLYTMAKYNGEALTTYTPRGKWADLHRTLSSIGTVHVENVHILANLEPFRYGSPDFIQKSVQAMHNVYGANGLHLYPQASYWDWPYTADKTSPRLLQLDRDWIWYKTWARYAWNSKRDRPTEVTYWGNQLADQYGLPADKGKDVLEAYEETGEISPKLLRRYGITDGNRQTLTLGMLMTQLINPFRYGLFTLMYESEAPEGEMIIEYAEKESKQEKHRGETPVQVADEVIEHGKKAVAAIDKAAGAVTKNKAEFDRLKNDVYAQNAMANFYAQKARAALAVLKYKYSTDVRDLEKAVPLLESSLEHYTDLVKLTKDTYLYANSMQTKQRKIPMRGVDGTYKTWEEMLPVYQKELTRFKSVIDSLKSAPVTVARQPVWFKPATVTIQSPTVETYAVEKGQRIFSDTGLAIAAVAEELKNLKGLQLAKSTQQSERTSLTFTASQPVKLLVGFFTEKNPRYLPAPELETDASANDYGQSEIKISNAVLVDGLPPVNVHTYSFKAGTHTLNLGKGACLLLGFMDGNQEIPVFDAGLAGNKKNIDWLFE